MKDYIGYITARILSFAFCLLPLRLSLFIGRSAGSLICLVNKKRRGIAYTNLRAAFCAEKSPGQLKAITAGVYRNLGCVLMEVLRFPVMGKSYIKKYVRVNGIENLERVVGKGKGAIVVTAHFGNWELMNLVGGHSGFPLSVLAREQKHTKLNGLLNSYRQMAGSRIIAKGFSTRQLIRALNANQVIGILMDQDAGKLGIFVDFFGRPASTHSGAFIFAERTGASVVPAFLIREKGPYHRVDILKPVEFSSKTDPKNGLYEGAQEFSSILEDYVRVNPTQWLWPHKRWKSTPKRTILVLSDGKAGHLNQSVAVAQIIQKYRQDKGCGAANTEYKVVEVKYRYGSLRPLLALCGNFSSSACQGCMKCLRLCLDKESYRRLIGTYADIVISCGSSLAPVNVLLSRENRAKAVTIMTPSMVSLKKFNLAIIPRHDRPKASKNVLITAGSPNTVNEEVMQNQARKLSSIFKFGESWKLAVFLGGSTPDYEMDVERIKKIVSQIKMASEKLDLEVLVTTSRRTPAGVEKMLKEELSGFPGCRLLVIANEKNIEGAVPGMLGLSRVAVVSGESMSMISEAASSGRQTLVFGLKKKNTAKTRHEALVEEFVNSGFIKLVDPDNMGEAIQKQFSSREAPVQLSDYNNIYNALGALI